MNVNNIQSGLVLQPTQGRTGSGRPPADSGGPVRNTDKLQSEQGSSLNDLQTVVDHIDYLKQQLDQMLNTYPPFFPAGSPQRMDWINKIRKVQEGVLKVTGNPQGNAVIQVLNDDATDGQIEGAVKGLVAFKEDLNRKGVLPRHGGRTGSLLNIKV